MKLAFDSVRFKNFMSYGNRWHEVSFQKGITLITGRNGSGKSSLLETIPVGLFGKSGRGVPKADIINWKNKKNCEVIIKFTVNNSTYSILRAIKPDKLEVYKNGNLIDDIAHDKRIIQKEIEESILGIDHKTFMNIIYSNLSNLEPILLMKKPEKRKFLERIFNLAYFSLFGDKTNERIKELDKRINKNENIISNNDTNISNLLDQNRDIQDRINGMKNSVPEVERLEKRMEKICSRVDIDDLKKTVDYIDSDISVMSSEIDFIQKKVDMIVQHKRYINSIIRNQDRIIQKEDELKKELSGMEGIKKEKESVELLLLTDENVEYWKNYIDEKTEEKDSLQESVDRMNENIIRHEAKLRPEVDTKTLERKTNCPTCGTEIDSERIIQEEQQRQEKIEREIDNLKRNKGYEVKKLSEIEEDIKETQDILKRHNDNLFQIKELQLQLSKADSIEEKLEEIKKAKAKKYRFGNAMRKLDEYETFQQKKIKKITDGIEKLDVKKEPMTKTIELVEKIENQIDELYNKIEQEEEYKREMEGIISSNNNKIRELKSSTEEVKKKIENLQILKDHMKALKSICSDENIKQYAISTRMPYVVKRTNHYLNNIGFDFYILLDKWMEHQIKGPGITGKSLKSFSGGETKSVDLSLRFALQDSLKVTSGVWPDTIVTDELLDSSIDSVCLTNIMEILRSKQIEDNMKMLLVSHRDEVGDVDIDHQIHIVKEGGFSKIV